MEVPAIPVVPAMEQNHCERYESEKGTGNDLPIPASRFCARTKYQNEQEHREDRELNQENILDQYLGKLCLAPDPSSSFPIIGNSFQDFCDFFDERAAIREYDGGYTRVEAEALAFAECISLVCGPSAGRDDQLDAAEKLKTLGIAIPSQWRPTERR